MIAASILLVGGVLGVLAWALLGPLRALAAESEGTADLLREVIDSIPKGFSEEDQRRLLEVEEAVDLLPRKWEEIKRDAKSLYGRASHHVGRAREELEARGLRDPELDELDGQLRLIDGGRSEVGGLREVPEGVEARKEGDGQAAADDYLSIANRRKFGG